MNNLKSLFLGTTMAVATVVATGFFSASPVFETQSFQITLETEEVPEPLTILGTGVALGFGAIFKKRAANCNKN